MRTGTAFGLALLLSGMLPCCEQDGEIRPQWLISLSTDAPLPGFGDRVRIDVLDEAGAACASCSRVFDTQGGAALPLSFGVQPLDDGGRRFVRARLYRAENTDAQGEPDEPLLDLLGELPALGESTLEVNIALGMACFGKPADAATLTSCNPASGEPSAPLALEVGDPTDLPTPGSWGGGEVGCNGEPPAGMRCIPGGVFLMGSRAFAPFGPDFDPVPEQLVRVRPYFMDADELDVATARASIAAGAPAPASASASEPRCTFTEEPGAAELASVNCVDRDTAAALCEANGKRLPTEAEWEFAAVARTNDAPFPWPTDGDLTTAKICRTAILARGDFDIAEASRHCILEEGVEAGPVDGGSPSDVTSLDVRNLAGNMSEWVADDFARYSDEICWGSTLSLHDDPQCTADDSFGVLRGGSWVSFTYNAHGFFRRKAPSNVELAYAGVRCAQDAD